MWGEGRILAAESFKQKKARKKRAPHAHPGGNDRCRSKRAREVEVANVGKDGESEMEV